MTTVDSTILQAVFYLGLVYIIYHIIRAYFDRVHIKNLSKRSILITGCDYGMGEIMAHRFSEMGVRVFAGCRTEQGMENLKSKSQQAGTSDKLKPVLLDVTKQEHVDRVAKLIYHEVKDMGLWAVVHNAAVCGAGLPDEWLSVDDYDNAWNVNALGVIRVTHLVSAGAIWCSGTTQHSCVILSNEALLPLIKKCHGRLVIMSSMVVRMSIQIPEYVVSKCALDAYANVIRRDLFHFGVSVHTIEPGFQRTAMSDSHALRDRIKRKWGKLSDEIKDDYGQEYMEKLTTWRTKWLNFWAGVNSVSNVIDCAVAATVSVWPRIRYVVGIDHRMGAFWLGLMPMEFSDFFIRPFQLLWIGAIPRKSVAGIFGFKRYFAGPFSEHCD